MQLPIASEFLVGLVSRKEYGGAKVHDAEKSVFQSDLPLKEKLERARTELLDLSARNRLLNVPRFSRSAKTIDVVDERTSEIYRLLVNEGKVFTFIAGKPDRVKAGQGEAETPDDEDDYSPVVLPQPDDNELDERGLARRHYDTSLQTRMTPTGLQRRLLDLYYEGLPGSCPSRHSWVLHRPCRCRPRAAWAIHPRH